MIKLIIDTDGGVDDVLAIAWLLSQKKYEISVLGITAVAGNTSVDNAANNILTVLNILGRTDIPVVVGAAKPFYRPLTRANALFHGPDGLWGAGQPASFDTKLLSHNPSRFFKEIVEKHNEVILLTLGPLTNVALAINQYPEAMAAFKETVTLGGTQFEGSMTPVAEYNFWQDPEAADVVLSASLPLTLVPREAFIPFKINISELQALAEVKSPALDLLYAPLQQYLAIQNQLGDSAGTSLPDLVAAIVAVDPGLCLSQPALVNIITGAGPVRGQSIIGFTLQERVSMIVNDKEMDQLAAEAMADSSFDLLSRLEQIAAREPVNCRIVSSVQVEAVRALFMETMLADISMAGTF